MKTLPQQSYFKNERVLVRVDFNVEIRMGKVIDDFDIQRALKTIRHVSNQAKYTLLISHFGNPKEGEGLKSLAPVANHLSKVLKKKVWFVFGKPRDLKKFLSFLPKGSVVLLENIRFYSGEYGPKGYVNSMSFAKELASLGDCYVNEAFGESHRKVSSICAITRFLPSFAGFNLQDEIKNLDKLKARPQKPFVVIFGGAKLKTKLPLIKIFVKKCDYILLGGGLANTFLRAQGFDVGKSLYEKEFVSEAKMLLKHKNIILPFDLSISSSLKNRSARVSLVADHRLSITGYIGDLGLDSVKYYSKIIKSAQTIVWNGPMGYYENPVFAKATLGVARAILANKRAFKIIGGGDTIAFLKNAKITNSKFKISNMFVSTGGGAMLEYLSGKNLSGVRALD